MILTAWGLEDCLTKRPARNQLRIIGGKWRGRKIHFPAAESIRPTGDRIRETLFNWLAGLVEGAACVDLFAGSGALGFEAASRGAASVLLVDQDRQIVRALSDTKRQLGAENMTIIEGPAQQVIRTLPKADLLFLDPPFNFTELDNFLSDIENSGILKPGARIYLESAADRAIVAPSRWHLHRHKQSGQVAYRLFQLPH